MIILEVTKKQMFTLFSDNTFFENIFLGSMRGFFLNESSILIYTKLAIFHSI